MLLFIAERSGKPAGRIAILPTPTPGAGGFGDFDAIFDHEVAGALFAAARDELRRRGHSSLRGPLGVAGAPGGLLIHGFETCPFIGMPYNAPYLPALAERAGLRPHRDFLSFFIRHPARLSELAGRKLSAIPNANEWRWRYRNAWPGIKSAPLKWALRTRGSRECRLVLAEPSSGGVVTSPAPDYLGGELGGIDAQDVVTVREITAAGGVPYKIYRTYEQILA